MVHKGQKWAAVPEDELWDDPDVGEDEVLYRHLHPDQWVRDAGTQGRRLSSVFMSVEPGEDGLSAYSAWRLSEYGFSVDETLPTDRHGYVEFTVGIARELGYGVAPDPNDELPINIAHMLIRLPRTRLSRRQRRDLGLELAKRVTIIRPPVV